MIPLPLANILHHKLRSGLSALGVGVGVCMLITLAGLSRGSMREVADRWSGVQADLIVYPGRWGDNITTLTGAGLDEADASTVTDLTIGDKRAVEYVVPIYLYRISIRGTEHNLVGVAPGDLHCLTGGKPLLDGATGLDPDGAFASWLANQIEHAGDKVIDISEEELAQHGGLEMVVDARLARTEKLSLGSTVYTAGHHFKVVGIAPEGSLARVMV